MNIFVENVDLKSFTGPNHFARKLVKYLALDGCEFTESKKYDVRLSFIQNRLKAHIPTVLRLDGIYFNKKQDYKTQNALIEKSYKESHGVIFQTEFNKDLIFKYFGEHDNYKIIPNGADLDGLSLISPSRFQLVEKFDKIWMCASMWRPHKRLEENVRYFKEHASKDDCLVIAGHVQYDANVMAMARDERIFFLSQQTPNQLASLYKMADNFIHLAWLDHCPNVVVDARACGCKIICSSAGGTQEIAGDNAIIIQEDEWDFEPCDLYSPPKLDFSRKTESKFRSEIDMKVVAKEYRGFLEKVKNENS